MPEASSCRRPCHAEGLVMPEALSCRRPCHAGGLVMPEALSCRRPCHPERSEGSGLPGRPEQPCSRMRFALYRAGIRAASPGRSFGLRPQDDKRRVEGAPTGKVLAYRRSWRTEGLGVPKVLAYRRPWRTEGLGVPKALAYPKSCHPEQREGSALRDDRDRRSARLRRDRRRRPLPCRRSRRNAHAPPSARSRPASGYRP